MDKETFYRIVQRLKLQGINTIGADTELSEDTIEFDEKSMDKLHKTGKVKKDDHTIKFIKEFIQKEVKRLKESVNENEKPIIVVYDGNRLAVDPNDLKRLKSGKDVVGKSAKHPGQEEWISAKGKWKVEESFNEGRVEWFWNAARENPEKKKNYTKFSNNIDQQKGKLTKDIVLKKAKEYKVKSEDALKFVSDMYADIKFESVNKSEAKVGSKIKVYRDVEDRKPLTMTLGRKIPNNDDDAYEATYEIFDSAGFQKRSREVTLEVAYGWLLRAKKPMWFLMDPGKLDNISKQAPYKESINKFIQKEVKALIKKKAKPVKEGAIRQWVIEGSPDMVLKVPQSTEMSRLNKRDFQAFLKHHKIDFDHIADGEMDESGIIYSHYLVYSDISPEMLKDLQDTYHASF
jgi:ferritin